MVRGHLYLVLALFSTAVSVIALKLLLPVINLYTYATLRFTISSIIILFFLLMSQKKIFLAKKGPHEKPVLHLKNHFLQAISTGLLFNIFFYSGLKFTTATSASIIGSIQPAVLTLFAFFLLKEKINNNKIWAIILSILGIVLLSLDNLSPSAVINATKREGSFLGDGLVFLSLLPQSYYSILLKQSKSNLTNLSSAFLVSLFAFISFLPFGLYHATDVDWSLIKGIYYLYIFLGSAAVFVFLFFWGKAMETISTSTAAVFTGLLPIMVSLLAIAFLNEVFTYADALGLIFVLTAIIIGELPSKTR